MLNAQTINMDKIIVKHKNLHLCTKVSHTEQRETQHKAKCGFYLSPVALWLATLITWPSTTEYVTYVSNK